MPFNHGGAFAQVLEASDPGGEDTGRPSVVLPDVLDSLLEDVVVADLELDVQSPPELLSDQLVTAVSGLPAFKPDSADDLVDPVHDVVDDDRGVLSLQRLEELGERGFAPFLSRHLIHCFFGCDRILGQLEQFPEEFEAGLLDVGVLLAQLVEPLPELHEDRVGQVPGDAGSDQLLDIFDVDLLYTPARHQVLNGCSV